MRKIKQYPKVDGERFDILRRRQFDEFKESFAWVIKEQIERVDSGKLLTKKQITEMSDVAGHNCAFISVTDK